MLARPGRRDGRGESARLGHVVPGQEAGEPFANCHRALQGTLVDFSVLNFFRQFFEAMQMHF